MANKTYNITQHVKVNGVPKASTFRFVGEESELTALAGLLEGGFTVTEQNDALSNMTGADTNVTAYKRSTRISMNGKTAEGHSVFASIRPFKGSIYFKQTASSADIEAVFAAAHPFPLAPTVKPSTVAVNFSEDVAGSD